MEEIRFPVTRPSFGTEGKHIPLLTNHFKVSVNVPYVIFYEYEVLITSAEGRTVHGGETGRKIMNTLNHTYCSELTIKHFAYDGQKNLYRVCPLPKTEFKFKVALDETKWFLVEISYVREIPIKSLAFTGNETNSTRDALNVLNIILRQQAVKRGCLVDGQSFFHDDKRYFLDVGDGVTACRGFHSSFCATKGGLTLNMDVCTTMILTPGPVLDFLLTNLNVRDPSLIDWERAKKMLKNLRIKTSHNNKEFIIKGLSEKPCNQQYFPLKAKNENGQGQSVEVTVSDFFTQHYKLDLSYSSYLPCLDIGRQNLPPYLPLELCSLVSMQLYKKALSTAQRSFLAEKSRQKPQEMLETVEDAVGNYCYEEDPLLSSCGILIEKQLTKVNGRLLHPPMLKVGTNEYCEPRNGRWNFNNMKVYEAVEIKNWAIVNFSSPYNIRDLSTKLIESGLKKGIHIECPCALIEEIPEWTKSSPVFRIQIVFEEVLKLPSLPEFLLCVLAERKNSDIYGPWKRKNLCEMGIVTQCISPVELDDQYLSNVLLKINVKLGGKNTLLVVEDVPRMPHVHDHETPTMIVGMDVSHGSPGQSGIPSIAAVVGSRYWPLISRYRASVRTQSPELEMINSLYKRLPNGEDHGMIRELLLDFYQTSNKRKPDQIIIFRNGVSESQFIQVLNIELEQIIKALEHLGVERFPKFTLVVAQKNHQTKFFQAVSLDHVRPGTVVDTKVLHPRNYDFYMCAAKAGMVVHYNVLLDEIGFSPDDLQKLVLDLSYVYQPSTTAASIVAPIQYAQSAAQQMRQIIEFDDISYTSSEDEDGIMPELPMLHEKVRSSMFFC